jgi:NAD(P)H dehydrogenase (quinone)
VNVLVVFCHPTRGSFMGAALDRVLAGLAAAGHEVRLTDLYADGFEPELTREDLAVHLEDRRDAPWERPAIAGSARDLRWAETLVLVYPTWWSGQPAMLKGWFDRVLVKGVAWDLPEGSTRIRPLLRNIRRIVAVTSHGSSKFVNVVEGEAGKRIVTRSIRVVCSRRCRTRWVALYGIDRSSDADRHAFLLRVEQEMLRLR